MENTPLSQTPPQATQPAPDEILLKQIKSVAGWIYAVAGLSLVNTVLFIAGSDTYFVVGSAITQLVDGMASSLGSAGKVIAAVFDIIAAGIMVGLGIMASKAKSWAYIVAISLYSLDTLLVLIAAIMAQMAGEKGGWFSTIFHFIALFYMFAGMMASFKIKKLHQKQASELISEPML